METEKIIKIKEIGSGYVRVNSVHAWAQLPKYIWESMEIVEAVDSQFMFEPEWHRLIK